MRLKSPWGFQRPHHHGKACPCKPREALPPKTVGTLGDRMKASGEQAAFTLGPQVNGWSEMGMSRVEKARNFEASPFWLHHSKVRNTSSRAQMGYQMD